LNGRYHGSHRPSTVVTRRYKRLLIASQSPVATGPSMRRGGAWTMPS
jgi:hypothetical protein